MYIDMLNGKAKQSIINAYEIDWAVKANDKEKIIKSVENMKKLCETILLLTDDENAKHYWK